MLKDSPYLLHVGLLAHPTEREAEVRQREEGEREEGEERERGGAELFATQSEVI